MSPFAEWLRAARQTTGWSQDRLATEVQDLDRECRVHQARISEWERGDGLPSLRQLTVTCAALRLSKEESAKGRDSWEAVQLENVPTMPDAPPTS